VSVTLVIDVSGSMRPKLGEVLVATLAFAQTSHPADELFTIGFNDQVVDWIGRNSIEAGDVRGLEAELRRLRAEGRTALYDGLEAGLDRLDRSSHPRKILLLISDGGDNASAATLEGVLARARRSNVAIYTIGLFDPQASDRNPKVLQSLARATGGQRYLPSSPSGLLGVCQRIAREIRSGYTVAFTPTSHDGRYHRVRVDVAAGADGPLNAKTRPGYTAVSRAAAPAAEQLR
jgi:Ca-activated chloride channel family protein